LPMMRPSRSRPDDSAKPGKDCQPAANLRAFWLSEHPMQHGTIGACSF
jgi:hypothetical protein